MRIGIRVGERGAALSIGEIVAQIRAVEQAGLATAWLNQHLGLDALTVLAIASQQTSRVELGTAAVATFPRHPAALAAQALTVQSAAGGRLTLGVGPSHAAFMAEQFGLDFGRPVRHTREYLTILRDLSEHGNARFDGDVFKVDVALTIGNAAPFAILLAAIGPLMVRLAGELADGVITWLAGPRAVQQHILPNLRRGAEKSRRPSPRLVVSLPVCVTDNVESTRVAAEASLRQYAKLPAYQTILALGGASAPVDVAIIGGPGRVQDQLNALEHAGATDFAAVLVGSTDDREQTTTFLSEYATQAQG